MDGQPALAVPTTPTSVESQLPPEDEGPLPNTEPEAGGASGSDVATEPAFEKAAEPTNAADVQAKEDLPCTCCRS